MSVAPQPNLAGGLLTGDCPTEECVEEEPCEAPGPVPIGWGCLIYTVGPGGPVACGVDRVGGGTAWSGPGWAGFDDVTNPESAWYPGFFGPQTFVVDGLGEYLETQEEYYFTGSLVVNGPGEPTMTLAQSDPP